MVALRESVATLASARPMRVERFDPAGEAEASIVVLHGADGLVRRGPQYRAMARTLAEHGYRAYLPHYFESTATGHALAARPLDALGWLGAIGDAIAHASPRPVGLVGFSLGAYLALAAAGNDERVAAVVDCFGGLPELVSEQLTRMPPVLILHGESDPVVPVSEAHKLARWLSRRGVEHDVQIYPGLGHNFIGESADDAMQRVIGFFDEHLRAPVVRAAS